MPVSISVGNDALRKRKACGFSTAWQMRAKKEAHAVRRALLGGFRSGSGMESGVYAHFLLVLSQQAEAAGFSQEEQELQSFFVAQLTLAKVRLRRLRPRRMDFMDG